MTLVDTRHLREECDSLHLSAILALLLTALSSGYNYNVFPASIYCLEELCDNSDSQYYATLVNSTTSKTVECSNSTTDSFGLVLKFVYDRNYRSNGFAAFFWGMPISMLPLAYFAQRHSSSNNALVVKVYMSLSFIQAFLSFLMPTVARASPIAAIVVRFLQGCAEGLNYGSVTAICKLFAPVQLVATVISLRLTVYRLGIVSVIWIAPELCKAFFDANYYISAGFSLVSGLCFAVIATYYLAREASYTNGRIETANDDFKKLVTQNDENIVTSCDPPTAGVETVVVIEDERSHIWSDLFRNCGFYSLLLGSIAIHMCTMFLFTFLPDYFFDIFHMPLSQNRWLSTAPTLAAAIVIPINGLIGDTVDRHIRPLASLKPFHSVACLLPSAILLWLALAAAQRTTAVVLQCLAYVALSAYVISIGRGSLALEPKLPVFVSSVVHASGCLGFVLLPYLIEFMPAGSLEQKWRIVLCLLSSLLILAWLSYLPVRFKHGR